MKCRCKTRKPMEEMAKYDRENFANYTEITVFWCSRCGRAVKVETSSYPYGIGDWYEPKTTKRSK